jgi:hypothetical protein
MKNTKSLPDNTGAFLAAMIQWCLKWGCDVQIRNKGCFGRDILDVYIRDEEDNLLDLSQMAGKKKVVFPELVFSKNDRHISIYGMNWEDLAQRFWYEHKKIYMELGVPMLDWKP